MESAWCTLMYQGMSTMLTLSRFTRNDRNTAWGTIMVKGKKFNLLLMREKAGRFRVGKIPG